MRKITLDQVLKVYASVLNGNVSREEASDWGRIKRQLIEDNTEKITPANDEEFIRGLIGYLDGIDKTNPDRAHGYILSNKNIARFLRN